MKQTIKDVQKKILETMMFIHHICMKNDIKYCIMGGTALGAIRHGGFIPWDDDLDIFMTPDNYEKFKGAMKKEHSEKYHLQEWRTCEDYLEYAKVRMNGTTFIESVYKDKKEMHHGIYVDIMILHKCPQNILMQKVIYYSSKYAVLVGLLQRNWEPKNKKQRVVSNMVRFLPNRILIKWAYKMIYAFDHMKENYDYCYFITKAKFHQGIFKKELLEKVKEVPFEDESLLAPEGIIEYLQFRYGDYMKLPSEQEQQEAIHAEIFDTEKGYENYIFNI